MHSDTAIFLLSNLPDRLQGVHPKLDRGYIFKDSAKISDRAAFCAYYYWLFHLSSRFSMIISFVFHINKGGILVNGKVGDEGFRVLGF